jgi:hypothetical protein
MAAAIAAAWLAALAANPGLNPRRWLEDQGVGTALAKALWPILLELWAQGYELGEQSARELTGGQGAAAPVGALIAVEGRGWLNQVVGTRLNALAAILASYTGNSAAALAKLLLGALTNAADATRIAVTEITRAFNAGAVAVYKADFLNEYRWVTGGPDPCELCLANEAAGPRFYGNPYPSGAIAPPQHPNCRCALIPVETH